MDTQDHQHSAQQPKEAIASIDASKSVIETFGILIFVVVVVEIVLVFGLNLYQNSRIKSLTALRETANTALRLPENATLNTQVSEVISGSEKLKTVLSQKVKWSKFYTLLDAVTPKNVKISSLSIADSGAFRAEGNTTSLADLARLIVAWREGTPSIASPFTQTSLNSNGYSEVSGRRLVTFSISGSVNTGLLK